MIESLKRLALLLILPFSPAAAGAEAVNTDDSILLGCSFPAFAKKQPGSENIYIFLKESGQRDGTISVVDNSSLLDGSTFHHWSKTSTGNGELWSFRESATEKTGTMLMLLPQTVELESGRPARVAMLGRYQGTNPRKGSCVIVNGAEATTLFEVLSAVEQKQ
jgi:hypothetical protein